MIPGAYTLYTDQSDEQLQEREKRSEPKTLSVTSSSHVTMARRRGATCLRVVDDTLKKLFFKLGALVGRQPGYFLIVPALLTALCASVSCH